MKVANFSQSLKVNADKRYNHISLSLCISKNQNSLLNPKDFENASDTLYIRIA
jgi:hypothetical protein